MREIAIETLEVSYLAERKRETELGEKRERERERESCGKREIEEGDRVSSQPGWN